MSKLLFLAYFLFFLHTFSCICIYYFLLKRGFVTFHSPKMLLIKFLLKGPGALSPPSPLLCEELVVSRPNQPVVGKGFFLFFKWNVFAKF